MRDAPEHTNFGERSQQYPQCELKGNLDPRVVHGEHGKVGPLLIWEGLGLIVERLDGGEAGRCRGFGLLKLTFPSNTTEQEKQTHRKYCPGLKQQRGPHFHNTHFKCFRALNTGEVSGLGKEVCRQTSKYQLKNMMSSCETQSLKSSVFTD